MCVWLPWCSRRTASASAGARRFVVLPHQAAAPEAAFPPARVSWPSCVHSWVRRALPWPSLWCMRICVCVCVCVCVLVFVCVCVCVAMRGGLRYGVAGSAWRPRACCAALATRARDPPRPARSKHRTTSARATLSGTRPCRAGAYAASSLTSRTATATARATVSCAAAVRAKVCVVCSGHLGRFPRNGLHPWHCASCLAPLPRFPPLLSSRLGFLPLSCPSCPSCSSPLRPSSSPPPCSLQIGASHESARASWRLHMQRAPHGPRCDAAAACALLPPPPLLPRPVPPLAGGRRAQVSSTSNARTGTAPS